MKNLDRLAAAAREQSVPWDGKRADRVLAATVERAAGARALRRSLGAAGAVAAVAFVLLRGSVAPAASPTDEPREARVAYDSIGDAGFARD